MEKRPEKPALRKGADSRYLACVLSGRAQKHTRHHLVKTGLG